MKRVIHQLVDDITGEDATGTIEFALDGVAYTIDLDDSNQSALRDALAPFIGNAQRVGRLPSAGGPARKQTAPTGDRNSREQNDAIRTWANSQGLKVSDRGRIKQEVVDKFNEAHKS